MVEKYNSDKSLLETLARIDQKISISFKKIAINADIDPDIACGFGRKFLEYTLRHLDKGRDHTKRPAWEKTSDQIKRLALDRVLTRSAARWAHTLNTLGNVGTHAQEPGEEATIEEANEALDTATKLARWLESTLSPEQRASIAAQAQPKPKSKNVKIERPVFDIERRASKKKESASFSAPYRSDISVNTPSIILRRPQEKPESVRKGSDLKPRHLRCLIYNEGISIILILLVRSGNLYSLPDFGMSLVDSYAHEGSRLHSIIDASLGLKVSVGAKCSPQFYIALSEHVGGFGQINLNESIPIWLNIKAINKININPDDIDLINIGIQKILSALPESKQTRVRKYLKM